MGDNPRPPVVPREHRGPLATMNVEELERARKIVTYDARAVANYSEALVGEVIARDWMTSTYKGRAKLRAVMVRPGGVPVLDYLFETGSGEFVVVEAKASKSQLWLRVALPVRPVFVPLSVPRCMLESWLRLSYA